MGDTFEEIPPERYPRLFANMGRELLSQESTQDVLDAITRLAVDTLQACEECGVLLIDRERNVFDTAAATGELVRSSDRAQFECEEGPCLDAARHERSFRVDNMPSETRWPHYQPRALELGIGSMMGFELYTHAGSLGALDMYARAPNAFDERVQEVGWVFASHAAVAIASAQHESFLRAGYTTRHEIGEAVGILMERYKLTSEEAFGVLKKASMDSNIKLRDVAQRVTRTGGTPGT